MEMATASVRWTPTGTLDPHHIFTLALRHLVEKRGWSGKVVKSVSTTRMVDRLTARYGLPVAGGRSLP